MKHSIRWWVQFVLLLALTGCTSTSGPSKYVTNWEQLKPGMSKGEVITLLGESPDQEGPLQIEPEPGQSYFDGLLATVLMHVLFESGYERWHYGDFEMFENLLNPSDKAFVVYFNTAGRVLKFRRPKIGLHSTTQPVPE